MNPLLITIPYCEKDVDLTRKMLTWMLELGDQRPNSCMLAADSLIPLDTVKSLADIIRPIFLNVETMLVPVPGDKQGWPKAPNVMFENVARQVMKCYKTPFFWMEPDAVPLDASWSIELASEYGLSPKRYMGPFIKNTTGQMDVPETHMSGCSVYPNDAFSDLETFTQADGSWDISSANFVVPRARNTNLIKHYYGTMDLAPVFVDEREDGSPINHVTIEKMIPESAVVFHRCKDGSLIDILRERRKPAPAPKRSKKPAETATVATVT